MTDLTMRSFRSLLPVNSDARFSTTSSSGWAVLIFSLFLAFQLTACTDEGEPAEPGMQDTAEASAGTTNAATNTMGTMGEGVSLDVAEQGPYGSYITDADGRALYMFTADTQGQSSACSGGCAEAWPPLLTDGGSVDAASAIDTTMIGTLEREDGTMQVTYNGWPLYHFQKDAGTGAIKGQDVHGFGGEWYLVSPKGQQIEATADEG